VAIVEARYTGIYQVRRFHLSIGHGGAVVCQLDVLPQFGIPPSDGELFVTDGFQALRIPGCRLDRASIVYSTSGHIVRVRILGPTWKWRLAGIDGVYNVPRADGSIEPGTERTPRELATLLFQAMRVPYFDVSGLPNQTRPFVNWRGHLAFPELTTLCHNLGCDFGLDVQGTIARIWPIGYGAQLPAGEEQTIDYGVDFSEPPDRIKAYTGPSEFQSKLLCECVMPDSDGVWKPIEDVDYKPQGGWDGVDSSDPLPDSTDEKARALAKKWLYRAWRAKSQADGSHKVPVFGDVNGMEDILPLHDWLVEHYENGGLFKQVGYLEGTVELSGDPLPNENSEEHDRIEVQHRTDGERGIVITDVPLFKLNDDGIRVKADVFYVCSYNVRDQERYGEVYHGLIRQIANNGTGDLPLHRPEIIRRVVAKYNKTSVTSTTDNVDEVNAQLDSHITALASEFQSVASLTKRYRGLIPIVIDGAIRNVSYFGQCDGDGKGCYTMASRNTETEPGMLVRPERLRRAAADRTRMQRDVLDYDRRKARRQGVLR
jgi:hypothetical protein